MYVVVNLPEKRPCESDDKDCPSRGRYQYNTNVVFDRKGMVIARYGKMLFDFPSGRGSNDFFSFRYRKYNLFGEAGMDVTPEPEEITFSTDFGVTFGTFTCFDILFQKPAIELVVKHGVTDIVFPTAWFSELPFLTGKINFFFIDSNLTSADLQ